MRKNRLQIYRSRRHVAVTLLVVIIPFVFLLIFARVANLTAAKLLSNLAVSSVRLFIAYFVAAALAWVLSVAFYKGRRSDIALPVFDVLQSFPTSAILPLATFLMGPSNLAVVIILVITVIWPIIFSIISTLKLIRKDWEEAAEILGLKGFAYLRYFLFPASITGLVTGSIIGLGDGWEAIVATEIIIGVRGGLGTFFQNYSNNTYVTLFGVLGFLIFIFAMNKIIWLPLLEWSHEKIED